ncbi:MAG: hypothetical protein ACFCVE_01580 [Phycisphaerae bacterium]
MPDGHSGARLLLLSAVAMLCGVPLVWAVGHLLALPQTLAYAPAGLAGIVLRTLAYNAGTATLALLLAWPAARLIAGGSRSAWLLLPLPLLLPSIVLGYAWRNALLLAGLSPEPQSALDVLRCIVSVATWLWPAAAVVVGLSMRRLDPDVLAAARLDGGEGRVRRRQLAGPVAAAWLACMVLAAGEFFVYEMTGISTVSTEVRTAFDIGGYVGMDTFFGTSLSARYAAATAVGLPMSLVTLLLASGVVWLLLRSPGQASETRLPAGPAVRLTGWGLMLLTSGGAAVALLAAGRWQTDLAAALMENWPQVLTSLLLASTVGGGVFLLGLLAAAAGRRAGVCAAASLVAFLFGGQMLALAVLQVWAWLRLQDLSVDIAFVQTAWVHLALYAWLGVAAGLWVNRATATLRAMAAVDGATGWQVARLVAWPLGWPLFATAAVLGFALSLTEVPAAVLLSPNTLMSLMMSWVHLLRWGPMIDVSLLILCAAVCCTLLLTLLVSLHARRSGAAGGLVLMLPLLLVMGCPSTDEPQAVWLETGRGDGQVVYPRAIAYSAAEDAFFVVDRVAHVQKIDSKGNHMLGWVMPAFESGKPVGLSVDEAGNLWIADTHYGRVSVYSSVGAFLFSFGEFGEGPGQFRLTTDVAFAGDEVFVAEYGGNDRISVFDRTGAYKRSFGSFGTGDGQFDRPQSITVIGQELFVADACNHRLVVFGLDGSFRRNLGQVGGGPGEFRFPYGLTGTPAGTLLVTEFGNNRIQEIDPQTGGSLGAWGSAGSGAGQLRYPWATAVDAAGRAVVVDSGNNRLQVVPLPLP